jgi:hypothetical protein
VEDENPDEIVPVAPAASGIARTRQARATPVLVVMFMVVLFMLFSCWLVVGTVFVLANASKA